MLLCSCCFDSFVADMSHNGTGTRRYIFFAGYALCHALSLPPDVMLLLLPFFMLSSRPRMIQPLLRRRQRCYAFSIRYFSLRYAEAICR